MSNSRNDKNKGLVPKLRFPEFRDAGEWEEKLLGEILKIGNGRDQKHLSDGNVPVYGSGGYMRSVNDYLYDGESACIGRKGTIDNPIFLTGKFWTVDTLFYTHSFKECLPIFVFSIFQNIDWLKHNEASGVPSLSKTNIEKIEVAVPKLPEQQKIADCLSSLDELIAAHAQKLNALKAYKKGLMQQLFPAEGETVPKLRFPEYRNSKEWKKIAIGEMTKVVAGATPSTSISEYWGGAVPWMSSGELNLKRVYDVEKRITELGLKDSSTKLVPPESVLIGLAGQGKTRGTVAINYIEICTNQSIASILPNDQEFVGEFLYQKMDSLYQYLRLLSKGDGGRGGLNLQIIKSIELPLPIIGEQQKIADCLSSIDELIAAHAQKLAALKAYKKGLMQQLFPSFDEVHT